MILMTALLQLYLFTTARGSQPFSGDPLQGQLRWCFDKGSAGNSPIFNRLIIKVALPGINSARISTTTRTHKNTLAKSKPTLQHAREYDCVFVWRECTSPPPHVRNLRLHWLCCGYAWTHKKYIHTNTYPCIYANIYIRTVHVRIPS